MNQELEKTEKRHQTLSLDSDQAQEILNELEEKLRTTLASRRQLMIAQLQAELKDGQPVWSVVPWIILRSMGHS